MRRFKGLAAVLSAALAVPMAIASFVPASAAPTTSYDDEAQKCINQNHVFVYAERDDGHVDTGCASEFSNGVEALKSAGFDLGGTDYGGDLGTFVDTINGYPENPDMFYAYWGYFHAQPAGKDTEAKWEYSQLGASSYHPKPGSIEAWHFMLIDGPWELPPTWTPKVDPASATPAASFEIPDKALQKCITDTIGTTTPTKEQLADLTSLSCRNKGIEDLTGINQLTGLGKVFLSGNKITDLKPLASLPSIFSLDINSNEVSDIAPLQSLTKLSRLDVGKNHIRDLSALKDIKGLTSITSNFQTVDGGSATVGVETAVPTAVDRTGKTFVADREVPEGVEIKGKNVTYPSAGDYVWQFRDSSMYFNGSITVHVKSAPAPVQPVNIPDANFKACLQDAVGQGKPLTADNLGALTEVKCINKGIKDITGAEALTGVKTLYLTTNEIENLKPLAGLTKLETLYLPNNHVKDLTPLAGLLNLRELSLDQNPITTVQPLSSLTNLADLTINQNKNKSGKYAYPGVSSLEGLGSLPKLERLVANNNVNLSDLSGISGATSLKKLFLNNDKISDLSPIKGLTNLVDVGFDDNEISDVSALAGMKNLTQIGLSSNHVSDLSPLSGLDKIAFMGLRVRWQTVTAPPVLAQQEVPVPVAKAADGTKVEFTVPEGVKVSDGKVTYPAASDGYKWAWSHKDANSHSEDFSGTWIQPVTAAAPTVSPSVTPTAPETTPTETPSVTPTPTVSPTVTPTETPSVTPTPTVSPTVTPTETPAETPTAPSAAIPTVASPVTSPGSPTPSARTRGPRQGNIPVTVSLRSTNLGLPATGV
ncbi:leucine-rich repeat domain-containing protein [Cutibacterium sp.]|uniref:leucine-rich repeat domain-containing protein n=1 Tax=Cutibacterium sp. TaxID=1912221 RepID=UPI0026DBAA70|nr:leucine-rich repeat domain-containing protein [Cutibacterium sp.]MDO4413100.1 leucine-rich repeat domain-containing protein [Cutibacterium sp.]